MDTLQTTTNAEALQQRASVLIEAGRTGAARPLLAAARRLGPATAGLAQLFARLALKDGALQEAATELDTALTLEPENAELRITRSELRQRLGDLDGATRDAADAVILDRTNPVSKALLGVLLLQLGRHSDAIACLQEAVSAQPDHPGFCRGLASALSAAGDLDAAFATLQAGIAAAPTAVELRNEAIMLCLQRRDFTRAAEVAEAARAAGIANASTFGLRGHALSSLGCHDEAAESYADAVKLEPNDPYVRHLAAASGTGTGTRAPEAYIRRVFDGYAEKFDNHLISLGYTVPGNIRRMMLTHPAVAAGQTLGPVLDIGCGTGLLALALSDLPIGPFTGVDLSAGMLEQAAAKQLYAELRNEELMTTLADESSRWPLILAGDVLCYFGALEQLFGLIHARLEPGGWFVFSTEELLPPAGDVIPDRQDWAAHRQGRYSHTEDYLERVAAETGLRIVHLSREPLRQEANEPVAGFITILERIRHDA